MTALHSDTEGIWLVIAIAVSAVATLADEFADSIWFKILKVGGLAVSGSLAIYRVRSYRPFVRYVSEAAWSSSAKGVEVVIPPSEHKRGSTPSVSFAIRSADGYAQCSTMIEVSTDVIVRVFAGALFNARITIRR